MTPQKTTCRCTRSVWAKDKGEVLAMLLRKRPCPKRKGNDNSNGFKGDGFEPEDCHNELVRHICLGGEAQR